jgi:hypothetical protein
MLAMIESANTNSQEIAPSKSAILAFGSTLTHLVVRSNTKHTIYL